MMSVAIVDVVYKGSSYRFDAMWPYPSYYPKDPRDAPPPSSEPDSFVIENPPVYPYVPPEVLNAYNDELDRMLERGETLKSTRESILGALGRVFDDVKVVQMELDPPGMLY